MSYTIDELQSHLYRTINFISYKEKVQLVNYSRPKLENDLVTWLTELIELVSSGATNNIYAVDGSLADDRVVSLNGNDLVFSGSQGIVAIIKEDGFYSGKKTELSGTTIINGVGQDDTANKILVLGNNNEVEYRDVNTISGANIYNSNGQINQTRLIQLPSASTVYWNAGPDITTSVLEIAANYISLGGQFKAATAITGALFLSDDINLFPEYSGDSQDARFLVYDATSNPGQRGLQWVDKDFLSGNNIYNSNGSLNSNRFVNGFDFDTQTYYGMNFVDVNSFVVGLAGQSGGGQLIMQGPTFFASSGSNSVNNRTNTLILSGFDEGSGVSGGSNVSFFGGDFNILFGSNITTASDYVYALTDNVAFNSGSDGSAVIGGTSNSVEGENIILLGLEAFVATEENTTHVNKLYAQGTVKLDSYGSGSNTGSVTYLLGVDADGNVIETVGGGSGLEYTAGTVLPSSPGDGSFFWHTADEILYMYQNDGSNQFWLDISTAVSNGTGGGGTSSAGILGSYSLGSIERQVASFNLVYYIRFLCPADILVNKMSFYIASSGTDNITLGIYDNNGNLLSSTLDTDTSTFTAGTIQEIPLQQGTNLEGGESYWLALKCDNGAINVGAKNIVESEYLCKAATETSPGLPSFLPSGGASTTAVYLNVIN